MTAVSTPTIPTADPPETYDRVYRLLHWSIAILFIVALGLGYWASLYPKGVAPRPALLDVHKSLGMTILMLALIRVTYRLSVPPPALPHSVGRLSRAAATVAHGLLYLVMLAMPVTGYLTSTAGNHSVPWFGLFEFPRLVKPSAGLEHATAFIHELGADLIYVVLAAHILGALWHGIKRDGVVRRMTGG